MGLSILQGPHQGAQKSTMTGMSDFKTSVSKFAFVMFMAHTPFLESITVILLKERLFLVFYF